MTLSNRLENFMKSIIRLFTTPSAQDLVERELAEAQRNLLYAQSTQEYAGAMVQYHQARIDRLTSRVNEQTSVLEAA
jgi:tryptophan synthase alpha subunit